jgi:predicted metal-dependent enzyme (double-stranded beta helix superfamily)
VKEGCAEMTYELSSFTEDLDKVVTEERDRYGAIVRRTEPLLKRLISDKSWLAARFCEPRAQGSVQYVLYRSSNFGYVITSVVFSPGYRTKIHDHGTWGLVGVWRGEEREERFRRTGDGAASGYTKLSLQKTVVNTEGSISHLVQPDEEIHRIETISSYPSCSIHIYGSDLDGKPRREFDLETNETKEFKVQFVVLD